MEAAVTLEATPREATNKGASRALRRAGQIPGIVYGGKSKNITFSLPENILSREYLKGGFFNKIVEIKTDKASYFALPKDIQMHPVSDRIEHIDFFEVNDNSTVTVSVPVHFLNLDRCRGVKRGGSLNIVRHSLELVCNVKNIPAFIEVDIKEMRIGDSLHISAVDLPEGATSAITDRDFTIATITGRGAQEEETTEATEASVDVPAEAQKSDGEAAAKADDAS